MNVSRETIYYILVVYDMTKRKVIYDSKAKMFDIKIPVDRIEIHYMNRGVSILSNISHDVHIICDMWSKPTKKKACACIYKGYTDLLEFIPYICGGYCIDVNEEKICNTVNDYLIRQKLMKRGYFNGNI